MSLKDLKFTTADFYDKDVSSLPDRPSEAGITAAELKARFDQIPKMMLALGGFNDMVDELTGENGAGNIGAKSDSFEGETVAEQLENAAEKLNEKIEGVTVNGNVAPVENGKAKITIPTNVSELDNDSGYINAAEGAALSRDAVNYTPQTRSAAEQKQARENIGAASRAELLQDMDAFAEDILAGDTDTLERANEYTDNAVADLQPKEAGKGLSEANFTATEKTKLSGIEAGAQKNPTALPNPAALSFTGAASATYDGSEAVTIEIPNGGGSAEAVTYTEQNLTEAQRAQARENIGALGINDVPEVPENVLTYDAQSLTEAQKTQARTNIGAASRGDLSAEAEELAADIAAGDAATLSSAKLYADEKSTAALNAAQTHAAATFQPKESGKGLSQENYTTTEKNKLAGIETGAQKNPTDVVKYTAQTLTAAQQTQARANIDAPSSGEVADMIEEVEEGFAAADAQNLSAAKSYADTKSGEALSSAKSYAETKSSEALQAANDSAAATYQPKETGKGLSEANFTASEKTKLSGIQAGAQVNPTMLPNPFPIIFSGAVNAEYYGDEVLRVRIPTGEGGSGGSSDFASVDGEPYFYNGTEDKKLALEENIIRANGIIKQEILPEGYPYATNKLIVGESTLNAADNGGDLLEFTIPNVIHNPTEGKQYVVTWNGREYAVTAAAFSIPTVTTGPVGVTLGGSGYPFTLTFIYPRFVDTVGFSNIGGDSSGSSSVTFSVAAVEEFDYTPIGFNLLPDGYPGMTVEEGYILEECQPTYSEGMGAFVVTEGLYYVEVGKEYTVTWNGAEYNCVVQIITSAPEEFAHFIGLPAIGNFAVVGGENTGEPFAILCIPKDQIGNFGFAYGVIPLDGSTEITLSIKGETEVPVPISREFLPVGYPYFVPGGETVLEPMWAVNELDFSIPLKENYSYIVTWGGVDYECKAFATFIEIDGVPIKMVGIGNGKVHGEIITEEPFEIVTIGGNVNGTVVYFDTAAMFSIKTGDSYLPIDERYISGNARSNLVNGNARGSLKTRNAAEDEEGGDAYTIGNYAIALGENAKAASHSSIAIGTDTRTSDNGSDDIAIGLGVVTTSISGAMALGKYNKGPESAYYQFAVGNGTDDDNRHTAIGISAHMSTTTIDLYGNVWIYEGSLRLKSPSGKWFKITVSDTGALSAIAI